jgi:putative protease
MKTALYVADVARTYRQAIDDYFASPALYESKKAYYMEEISKCTYRQYTTGFFYGPTTHESQIYDNNTYVKRYTYLGIVNGVDEKGYALMEQRNKFCVGDTVEIMKPSGENLFVTVKGMLDEHDKEIESCPHPQQKIKVLFDTVPDEMDIIRVPEDDRSLMP